MIKMSVTDSGPGIPKEELENIFRLFYQADSGKDKVGTGIGLALTKELVDLHHGKIDVKSELDRGTCFSVSLPMTEVQPTGPEPVDPVPIWENNSAEENLDLTIAGSQEHKEMAKSILIVEDNYELQISLRDIFMGYYNVLLAENGEEGLQMALEKQPDIIITDVM